MFNKNLVLQFHFSRELIIWNQSNTFIVIQLIYCKCFVNLVKKFNIKDKKILTARCLKSIILAILRTGSVHTKSILAHKKALKV